MTDGVAHFDGAVEVLLQIKTASDQVEWRQTSGRDVNFYVRADLVIINHGGVEVVPAVDRVVYADGAPAVLRARL